MAEQADIKELPRNAQRVLGVLKEAGKPLSAYEVLDQLRPLGVTAPPTVYRSLDRLVTNGLIHRLESLNAFVACSEGHAHGPSAFAICTGCRTVVEMESRTLPGDLESWADKEGFAISSVAIEVLGQCSDCRSGG